MEPEIVYRFVGDGSAILPGVPGRDLTQADLDSLPAHVVADIAASDLYEAVGPQLPLPEEGD